MDRRESLKTLFVGSLAGGMTISGCNPATSEEQQVLPERERQEGYGRTPQELERDEKLLSQTFFTSHEMETLATLCDLILPAEEGYRSATEAGVPEFMEFMAKDLPEHQTPIRGGIMWLDSRSNHLFNQEFKGLSPDQHKAICDEIAYPDNEDPSLQPGIQFFTLVRDLTLTGFYTTKLGIEELGYVGNAPNVWDGVPEEVLRKHGMSYDDEMLAKYVDQSKRTDIADWDDEGNLIT